jgi:hypothetical protein
MTGPQGPESKTQAGSAFISLLYMSLLQYRTGQKVSPHPARAGDPTYHHPAAPRLTEGFTCDAYADTHPPSPLPPSLPPLWLAAVAVAVAAAAALHPLSPCPAPVAAAAALQLLLLLVLRLLLVLPLHSSCCCCWCSCRPLLLPWRALAAGRGRWWLLDVAERPVRAAVAARPASEEQQKLQKSGPGRRKSKPAAAAHAPAPHSCQDSPLSLCVL